jgi:hypothetical protein
MSPFEVVQAMQSTGVGVVGLDLRRTVVVLRFVEVGETAVICYYFNLSAIVLLIGFLYSDLEQRTRSNACRVGLGSDLYSTLTL